MAVLHRDGHAASVPRATGLGGQPRFYAPPAAVGAAPVSGAAQALSSGPGSRPRSDLGKGVASVEESVTLDNGGFAALELSSRHLHVKGTFSKKNGAR